MGRRSKYTPETVDKICQAIELGATYKLACQYAGINFDTFCQWRETKSEFSDRINTAEGKAAHRWLAKIEVAANVHWQAAAWKLERRYPQDYGKTVQEQQHTGKDGGPLTITIFAEDTKGPQ